MSNPPETNERKINQPETNQPQTNQSETAPDTNQPKTNEPETNQPKMNEPESEQQELELPCHTMLFPVPPMAKQEVFDLDARGQVRWKLPVHVRVEVYPCSPRNECFFIVTEDQKPWPGEDGFTAASAVHNDTFTFRTKVFGEFPPVELHKESRLRPNKWK
eukprot:TRINITY_DN20913_c0_g1_i1.p1 TRINITY_DN20913_c0_g1~~TRINITY_DN20913_c0_g1_i1.p1  ORF type:complete len:161 (+),score=21.79 TRINITY_DN20913_c0_g1_i1:252-734(+)